jgi:DNA-binding IclR family transcriptional regulator
MTAPVPSVGRDGPRRSEVGTVAKAAALLRFVAGRRPPPTLRQIAQAIGVSRATAYRYVSSLQRTHLLAHDHRDGTFRLGPGIFPLGASAHAGLSLISTAGPIMEQLSRALNETVVMSIWDGDAPAIVRVADCSDRLVRVTVMTGARLDLDSAQAAVFLAHLNPDAPTPTLGLAVGSPRNHGIRSLAAPIILFGELVAVIAVIGTTATVPDGADSPVANSLRAAALRVGAHLGSDHAVPTEGYP